MPKKSAGAAKRPRASKEICFVIMPFGGWLDDYYEDIYKPAIVAAGLEPHRADDLFRPSTIVNDIWAYTKKARLVLADLSGKNPNVFYELGLAHALAKPAILVAESMDDVPFDLRALRVLVYDKNAPDWGNILRDKVRSSLAELLKAPAASVLPTFLDTKNAAPKPTVTTHEKEMLEIRQQLDLLREELQHPSRVRRNGGDIGPDSAMTLIREYVKAGLPEAVIVRRLQDLGPPAVWITRQIRSVKNERRRDASPKAP